MTRPCRRMPVAPRPAFTSSCAWRTLCMTSSRPISPSAVSAYSLRNNADASAAARRGPVMRKRAPRLASRTPKASSIRRKCSSKGPHTAANRALLAGLSASSVVFSPALARAGCAPGSGTAGKRLRLAQATAQRMGKRTGNLDIDKSADERARPGEIDPAVVLGAPGDLVAVLDAGFFHQHALARAHHRLADGRTVLAQQRLQAFQAPMFHVRGDEIAHVGGRRARARAVNETEGLVDVTIAHQLHGGLEVGLAFVGKTDDEIRADREPRPGLAQAAELRLVLERGMAALHHAEYPIGAALHRQMQVRGELRLGGVGLDQALGEFHRVRGGETNPLDALECRRVVDEACQVGRAAVMARAPIGIHVLAEEGDFAYALLRQPEHLGEHIVEGAAHLLAARVGHDAIGAIFAAALHDRDEGR